MDSHSNRQDNSSDTGDRNSEQKQIDGQGASGHPTGSSEITYRQDGIEEAAHSTSPESEENRRAVKTESKRAGITSDPLQSGDAPVGLATDASGPSAVANLIVKSQSRENNSTDHSQADEESPVHPLVVDRPELLIPSDCYRVRLTRVERVYHRRNGCRGADLKFVIIEGPFAGRVVHTPFWAPHARLSDSQFCQLNDTTLAAARALGIRGAGGHESPERTMFRQCVGAEVTVRIGIDDWESTRREGGREYRNSVWGFMGQAEYPFGVSSEPVRPFAEAPDPHLIRRWAESALARCPVVVRAIGLPGPWGKVNQSYEVVYSGLDQIDRLVEDVTDFCERGAKAVYYVLNPVKAEYLGPGDGQFPLNVIRCGRPQVADCHIERRARLLIDVDPERRNGAKKTESATAEEMAAAIGLAEKIRALFGHHGFPDPMAVASGNGGGLTYLLDLPADDDRIERLLKLLASEFDDPEAKVDTACYNAGRISKIPGTVARKGVASAERPHRTARILGDTVDGGVVPVDRIDAVIAELAARHPEVGRSRPARPQRVSGQDRDATSGAEDADEAMAQETDELLLDGAVIDRMLGQAVEVLGRHGCHARLGGLTPDEGRFLICFEHCPLEDQHSNPSAPGHAAVMLDRSGFWSAKCFHSGHGDLSFRRVLELLGIGWDEWPFHPEVSPDEYDFDADLPQFECRNKTCSVRTPCRSCRERLRERRATRQREEAERDAEILASVDMPDDPEPPPPEPEIYESRARQIDESYYCELIATAVQRADSLIDTGPEMSEDYLARLPAGIRPIVPHLHPPVRASVRDRLRDHDAAADDALQRMLASQTTLYRLHLLPLTQVEDCLGPGGPCRVCSTLNPTMGTARLRLVQFRCHEKGCTWCHVLNKVHYTDELIALFGRWHAIGRTAVQYRVEATLVEGQTNRSSQTPGRAADPREGLRRKTKQSVRVQRGSEWDRVRRIVSARSGTDYLTVRESRTHLRLVTWVPIPELTPIKQASCPETLSEICDLLWALPGETFDDGTPVGQWITRGKAARPCEYDLPPEDTGDYVELWSKVRYIPEFVKELANDAILLSQMEAHVLSNGVEGRQATANLPWVRDEAALWDFHRRVVRLYVTAAAKEWYARRSAAWQANQARRPPCRYWLLNAFRFRTTC